MKKRILSILLTLVMVIGMLPMASLTAHAEGSGDDCYIQIAGTKIDDLNVAASGDGWEYIPGDIPTVILNNYHGKGICLYDETPEKGRDSIVSFKVLVNGNCTITGSNFGIGLFTDTEFYKGGNEGVRSDLIISLEDNASLTINTNVGIANRSFRPFTQIRGEATTANCKVDINATAVGISAYGSYVSYSDGDDSWLTTYGGDVAVYYGVILDVEAEDPFINNESHAPATLKVRLGAMVSMTSTTDEHFINLGTGRLYEIPDDYTAYINSKKSELLIYIPAEPEFKDQSPVGSDDQTTGLTYTVGDTVDFTFDSDTPNGFTVKKSAKLKGLIAGLDADQTVSNDTDSALTLTHKFENEGLYQLTETLKLYFGSQLVGTKTHSFLIEVAAAPAVLDDIEITRSNTNMAHTNGQEFDKKRIEVTANYSDGSSKVLNDSDYTVVYQNGTALKTGDTYVTIKYTEDGVTKTTTKAVTVTESQYSCEFNSYDDLDFGTANVGYTSGIMTTDDVKAKSIVVEATGSGYHSYKYEISDTTKFEVVQESEGFATGGSEPGDTDSIRIAPKEELPAGVYNETVYVYVQGSGVGHTFNLKFVVSDGHEHTYTTDFNNSNEFYHWKECTDPNCTASDKGRKDVTPHNWDIEHPVVVDPATCTEDGVGKIECTTCGAYQNTTVYATGHDWGEWPSYITPRCNEAPITITRTCENDESHTDSKTINGIHMATDWTTDENNHWKICEYCEVVFIEPKEAHEDNNSDSKCDTCEYDMTPAVQPTEIDSITIEGIPTPQIDQTIKEYYDIIKSKHNAGTLTVNGDMYNYENERYGNLQTGGVYFEDENYYILEASSNEPIAAGTYYYCTFFAPIEGYVFADDVEVNVPGATEVEIFNDDGEIGVYVKFVLTESAPTEYDITVNGGTASANKAVEGTSVTITANAAPAGKVFDKWVIDGITVEDPKATTITFTMPANNVSAEATYKDQIFIVNYLVTFDFNDGTGNTAKVLVAQGDTVAKPADPTRSGYTFKGWYLNGTKYDFTAPVTETITLTAKWDKNSTGGGIVIPTVFPVTVKESDNGEVEASAKYAVPGSTVKLTVTPDEGYELDTLTVKSGSKFINVTEKNGKYQFVMPFGSVTVTATFKAVNPYNDVDTDDWFYDDVLYVTLKDLMNGTGNGKFSPEITTDRAMLVTVLWRLEGCPVVDSPVAFDDVADGLWYSDAIDWASANGIVNGYGDGKFGPTDQITREQIAALLNRYAAYKNWTDGTALPMIPQYNCSIWAENNVIWADMNGLLNGLGVDITDMTAKASRAELAAYLARFYKAFAEN